MAEYLIQDTSLISIADQVKALIGNNSSMSPSGMSSNIQYANNQINEQTDIIEQIKNLLYNKLCKNATIGIATASTSMAANNISFSNIPSNPSMYFMILTNKNTFNLSSTAYITNIQYDGSTIQSYSMKSSSGTTWLASNTDITASYTNRTLKLTSASARFVGNSYALIYVIQPTSYAKDILFTTTSGALSSNNKSISFTELPGDVSAFSIVPITNSNRSNTAHVCNVILADNEYKLTYIAYSSNLYKVTSSTTGVSKSFNNGTLTVTCNTPYFISGVNYRLVAVVAG